MKESENYRLYYNVIEKLGEGTLASVYKVETKDSKEKRALKLIDINKIRTAYKKKYFK